MLDLFYRNPRLLVLAIGLIVVAGISSFAVLPRMEDPVLTPRVANINTRFPGANAERVESLVTEKIEDELIEVKEIKELRSVSRRGISTITVELRDEITEVEEVWSRVRNRLDDSVPNLPSGALEPDFDRLHVKAFAMIISLKWTRDDNPNYAILNRLSEDLEDTLRSIAGTEEVDFFGVPDEEILVEFRKEDLNALGITPQSLADLIRASDAKVAAGQVRGNEVDLTVMIDEELDSIQRIGQIPIVSGENGTFTRVSDIATVSKGISDPPGSLAFVDGRPAISVGVLVRPSYRVDLWTNEVNERLQEFSDSLPEGVEASVTFEQNEYVSTRLRSLVGNLVLGGLAVVLVILVLMGWRNAIVVGSALPLASFMVLTGLRLLEIPIHQMSVTGLIIALGLLIDNAIVIVDEVSEHLRHGETATASVRKSVKHLAIPLFGSTLTTALAFAPIASMPGPAGEFVGSIAISVILAISSSFLLAMTITPALTALIYQMGWMKNGSEEGVADRANQPFWQYGISVPRLSAWYRRSIGLVVARPWIGIAIGLALPIMGFVQARLLPEQFFPPADRDQLQIELELSPQASLQETIAVTKEIRETLLAETRIEGVDWFLGESAPTFYYNVVPRRKNTARYAQALVKLDSAEEIRPLIHQLQAKLDREFPGSRALVRQLEQGPPFDAPIEVRVFGSDLEQLHLVGEEVRQVVNGTPRVIHSRSELSERLPKIAFKIDEEQARLAGLDHTSIASQLEAALEGAIGGSVLEATEELPVRVRVYDELRANTNSIGSVDLLGENQSTSQEGASNRYSGVPIGSLAKMNVKPELGAIMHFNGRRLNEIQAFLPAGVLPSEVQEVVQQRLDDADISLPSGFSIEYGGEAAKRDDAVGNLMANIGILAVLMVATLVLSFSSFRMATLIGVVAFLSVGLGTGALWLFGYPFGFMAIVGTMGLIGIAINDSIVVLAALQADEDAKRGDADAMQRVVERSTRHVVATSLTTMAGFTPLVLAGGGFWPPMAISIAGGVLGATVLALYFVPAAFRVMMCRECMRKESAQRNQTATDAAEELPRRTHENQRHEAGTLV